MQRVLITGMSGSGKSTIVAALYSEGVPAFDADDDWVVLQPDGTQRWKIDAVRALLADESHEVIVFAGCEENMTEVLGLFDQIVLLTAPTEVLLHRIATRTDNSFGKAEHERERILADLREVEPRLRTVATHVVDTAQPLPDVLREIRLICGVD